MTTPATFAIVVVDHIATYSDPIQMKKGERIRLTDRKDVWDGHVWLWAIGTDGREGWVPDVAITRKAKSTFSRLDYSARELTARSGESLEILSQMHGWAWCRNGKGAQGWVPLCALKLNE